LRLNPESRKVRKCIFSLFIHEVFPPTGAFYLSSSLETYAQYYLIIHIIPVKDKEDCIKIGRLKRKDCGLRNRGYSCDAEDYKYYNILGREILCINIFPRNPQKT
jgi:hypothetical protein